MGVALELGTLLRAIWYVKLTDGTMLALLWIIKWIYRGSGRTDGQWFWTVILGTRVRTKGASIVQMDMDVGSVLWC